MKHQIMTVMLDAFLIINALPLSFCKNASPTFSMVHLLHRLYGVDAPSAASCCIGCDRRVRPITSWAGDGVLPEKQLRR